jgi:transposase
MIQIAIIKFLLLKFLKMKKTTELTELERGKVLGLRLGGNSMSVISKKLKIPKTTVYDTIKRHMNSENVKSAPRSGRPKALNEDDQKKLKDIVINNNRNSAELIQREFTIESGKKVSTKTIRKNLHELKIYSRIAAVKPLLSEKQRLRRLKWCNQRKHWTIKNWKTVIWSDESRFTIFKNDGPGRVWRKDGHRYDIENLVPSVKHGGGGIMVWGCFSGKGLGPLVKVDGKMNRWDYIDILEKNLLPLVRNKFNNRNYSFQDDNAPVHTAKAVQDWIKENRIKILEDWPSQSPDLNPIEHLWHELETRLRKRTIHPKKVSELEEALKEEWSKIPYERLGKLIESMPKRIEACISSNGWPTKY